MYSPLVVFDLDGTLIDTAPDLIASLNHTIAVAGLDPVTSADFTHLVGHGAKAMIERAFALRGRPLADAEFSPMLERFITFYGDMMPGDSKPYPGLLAALNRLAQSGCKLAVCTNKPESLALTLIERLGMAAYFAAIAGGDTFPVRKPDARHLIGTIEQARGDPRKTVMVGDSLNDILVARNAAIPSIAVPFGYSDVAVERLESDHIIGHFDELTPALVDRLLAERVNV